MTGKIVLRLLAVGAMAVAMAQPAAAASCKKLCKHVIKDCQTLVGKPGKACKGKTGSDKSTCKHDIKAARAACKTSALAGCATAANGTCPAVGSASGVFAFID